MFVCHACRCLVIMLSVAPFGHASVSRSRAEAALDPEFPGPPKPYKETSIKDYLDRRPSSSMIRIDGMHTGDKRHDTSAYIASQMMRATTHQLRGSVSIHHLPQSVTFAQCSAFLNGVAESKCVKPEQIFIGTSNGNLRASMSFDYQKPAKSQLAAQQENASGGRKRKASHSQDAVQKEVSDVAAQVDRAIDQVKKQSKRGFLPSEELLESACVSLNALLNGLRGASGEHAVESWSLSARSPNGQAIGHQPLARQPDLILSIRICGGVAVPIQTLKRTLGPSFTDGMITTASSTAQRPTGFTLPVTEQGAVTEREGQPSMMIYSAIAPLPPPPKPPSSPSLVNDPGCDAGSVDILPQNGAKRARL